MSGPEKQQPCLHLENNMEATKANTESPEAFGLADEKRLVRKLDRTILPWIMLLYLLSYIDRSNMGNARNIGLEDGLANSPAPVWAWLSGWKRLCFYYHDFLKHLGSL